MWGPWYVESSSSSLVALCPSAPYDWNGSQIIGFVRGSVTHPEVIYSNHPVAFDAQELAELTAPLDPTEVVRIAAPCARNDCQHFVDERCSLVERTVEMLPSAVQLAPRCSIRRSCLWFAQEGVSACQRCPAVITSVRTNDPRVRAAANSTPPGPRD